MKYKWLIVRLACLFVPVYGQDAISVLREKAELGNVEAQVELGNCYFKGDSVSQDYKEAAKWYRLAAEQECAEARVRLGGLYYFGFGVVEDYKEAVKWYRLAAEQGNSLGQVGLAGCYDSGKGVLQDFIEAYAWTLVAAQNSGQSITAVIDWLRSQMTNAQISMAQQRAKELQEMIERKKQIAKLPAGQLPSVDIAPSGYGSGLLIKGGYVVTCCHVVDKAQKISISCQGKDFPARLIQKDAGNDIAILRVDGADAGATLSFADSVKLGAQVFTMGFPHPGLQGSDVKFTTGSISGLTGPGNTPVYYQISAPLQSGNSGGPLFDEYGNLVGIVAAKLDSLKMLAATGDLTQNVNYAIKSDYLVPLLKTVDGIKIQPSQTKPVNLLSLVEELKKSVVMIKVY